jgi:hypothetical protein
MSWPTDALDRVLTKVDDSMLRIKSYAERAETQMAAGNVSTSQIINLRNHLLREHTILTELQSYPGLAAYAQNQKGDQALDVTAEFMAVKGAITNVTDNIESTMPKNASGYLLMTKFTATGTSDRTFSSEQTATLRELLNTLIATVE